MANEENSTATTHSFDRWQREVIEIGSGRHLVLAPPGCGKTDILTERIVHAHEAGVDYADMLCLTFTNRAAKSMAGRVADRTGGSVPDTLYVGNIHRFCSQFIASCGLVGRSSTVMDETDVDNIVQEELCPRLGIRSRTTELMRFQHALWQASLGHDEHVVLHGELLHTSSMHKLCDVLQMPPTIETLGYVYAHLEHFMERYTVMHELLATATMQLAAAYQDYKKRHALLDYDDLLVLAYDHLMRARCGAVAEVRQYGWVEVDEVQDLNPLQLALIDLFAAPDATVVFLGDEQQAIFSFIGAKLETLEALKRRGGMEVHRLHNNYRSPRYLLDLQNDYAVANLGLSRDQLTTTMRSEQAVPGDVCLLDVGDARLEAYYAARFAKRFADLDTDGSGKVAVLVSTNSDADMVADEMERQGIGHFKISGTDLFSLPSVQLVLAHLAVVADEMVFLPWARIMWGLRVVSSYTAARSLMAEMRRVALLPTDFLEEGQVSYVQQMVKAYEDEDVVIFDTETTGLDTELDDIIQIAAVRVRRGKVVGRPFNIVLETSRQLPAMVGGKPNPMLEVYGKSRRWQREKGLAAFMDYCKGSVLVGHNVEFDYSILDANLRRSCPNISLEELCPRRFDTLKYIRLLRPDMGSYKLESLLAALHLEGKNSHRADDDIMATLSLLDYCHRVALPLVAEQRMFASVHSIKMERLRQRYSGLYASAFHRSGIADALEDAYRQLVEGKVIAPVAKWPHLTHYVEADLVRTDVYPTLRSQLSRYVIDLTTTKEADLCGGSLKERFIISTVHKAKGLEFEAVIVFRCVDGIYPGQRSWTEPQIAEDARRLFVALSRSKRRLLVLTDSGYDNSPHRLSPFLDKVRGHFILYHRTPEGRIREG
ncbi:MAG: UvrD-helicase domain-containing protein [Bacteroidales bacterium]|nr:UvrD-helicase domain-containing protein [Bacteroidales bacterium]